MNQFEVMYLVIIGGILITLIRKEKTTTLKDKTPFQIAYLTLGLVFGLILRTIIYK